MKHIFQHLRNNTKRIISIGTSQQDYYQIISTAFKAATASNSSIHAIRNAITTIDRQDKKRNKIKN